jgi:DNA-binding XRE family transcriptional regulator
MSHDLRTRLKEARKKLGLTQERAAKAWQVPLDTLIRWENNRRSPSTFTPAMLNQLLDEILDMDPPARGDQPATGLSFSVGRWLPKADAGPSGDEDAGG